MRNFARTVLVLSIALAVTGVLIFGRSAQADHDPGDPEIDILAIDANTAGNTATHVESIEPCASLAGPGSTVSVDIAVDQIPAEAISGFATNLTYDPAIVSVTGLQYNLLMAAGGPMQATDSSDNVPDTDGDFRIDVLDFSGSQESGEGVIARVTFQAVANGVTTLDLDDLIADGIPDVLDGSGTSYIIHNIDAASLSVGQACAPTTDLAATAATVSAPASSSAGTAFNVLAGGTIVNNGPVSSVNADAKVTLNLPPDCTAAGGNQHTVQDLSLASGSPVTVPNQTFSVTCNSPSFHTFTSAVSVMLDDLGAAEVAFGNNQWSSSLVTTAITAMSDLQLQSVTLSVDPGATPTPMAGISFNILAAIVVRNSGPNGPASASGTALLVVPADCRIVTAIFPNPRSYTASVAVNGTATVNESWLLACNNPGAHSFTVNATVAAADIHTTDAPGNNSGSAGISATMKVGACGDDPNPAGDITQNLSPQLLLLVQSLTATGTPVADNLKFQLQCDFSITASDAAHTPIDECPVKLVGEAPCSLTFDLHIDVPGGSTPGEPGVRLNPVGVTFLPAAFDWANDTEVPNGTKTGVADFNIRTDGGLLTVHGFECTLPPVFPLTNGIEGGIQGNVPDSNSSDDLLNPNVWPNDLNAEKALVESSFSAPIPGLPSGVTLWSRTIVKLETAGMVIPMNILTWKVTNPAFQALTGANWVIVPFPSDALNPDPAGAVGGNPDADDPVAIPDTTYCTPEHLGMTFNGMAGNVVFLSCHTPGTPMAWNLVDPDALNVSGDEGPRSDTSTCSLDTDSDGLSAGAETYYGTNPNSADTDGDGWKDDREVYLTTDPTNACADTPVISDESGLDANPFDFNDNQLVNGQDTGRFGPVYNKLLANLPASATRFDLNGDGIVNGQDTGRFGPVYNTHLC